LLGLFLIGPLWALVLLVRFPWTTRHEMAIFLAMFGCVELGFLIRDVKAYRSLGAGTSAQGG
jgi:hypothetical protein